MLRYEMKTSQFTASHFNSEYATHPEINGLCLISNINIGEKLSNPRFLKVTTTKSFLTVNIHFFPSEFKWEGLG